MVPANFAFQTQEIRVIAEGGEPWFVAADVAQALGYHHTHDLTRVLEDYEKGTQIVRTPGGEQEMRVINESGLYSAVLKSRKPEAKVFKRWVTCEVLPTIRKTGSYTLTVSLEQQQEIKDLIARVSRETGQTHGALYARLHNKFKIPRYRELPAAYFVEALAYLRDKLPPSQMFYGLRDGRYLLSVDGGRTSIRQLHNHAFVALDQADTIRRNMAVLASQMRVFSGEAGAETLGIQLEKLPEAET